MMDSNKRRDLLQLSSPLTEIFSFIQDIAFFVKDINGKFAAANRAFLRLMEVDSLAEIEGKTDLDFVPAKLARVYMHADRKVMDSGKPLVDLVEPLPKGKSPKARIVTSKIPLKSPDGTVVGLVGIARNLTDGMRHPAGGTHFSKTISVLEDPEFKHYDGEALARFQGMSKSKFEREFKKLFHMSPAAYHLQTRLRWARNDLLYTMNPISQIAFDHGFCDQSHFTKRFTSAFGITPLRYRKKASTPLPEESAVAPSGFPQKI